MLAHQERVRRRAGHEERHAGRLNGLLESIDPFASYLNAEQYRDYLKKKDRKRADVGLILSKRFGYLGVVGVVPESPAAKAGLGDAAT